jgi:hypothetical protein
MIKSPLDEALEEMEKQCQEEEKFLKEYEERQTYFKFKKLPIEKINNKLNCFQRFLYWVFHWI